jgi:hypothetical protein
MNAPLQLEPDPFAIDPRPCELCGLTIDRHEMVDDGEGPQFFCMDLPLDEMTLDELERLAKLIRLVEVAEIMARMEAMDDPSRRLPPPAERVSVRPIPFRVPSSTLEAFNYVVSLGDPEYLARWLRDHSDVAANLLEGVGKC